MTVSATTLIGQGSDDLFLPRRSRAMPACGARMEYLTEDGKRALSAAVAAIESTSSAEVVVAVRPRSTPPLVPAGLAGAAGGTLGLAFLLFSPWPFSHVAILLDTVLCGLMLAAICLRLPLLARWLTPPSVAQACVERAAQAEFVTLGVSATRDRTGLLVYVSQVERRAHVVADLGLERGVSESEEYRAAKARLLESVRGGGDARSLAEALQALEPLLREALPRRADDTNELGDAVC